MRRKKYTELGISRVPCERCGEPSITQWQICATGNKWAGVCAECDVALNEMVVVFMGLPWVLAERYRLAKMPRHEITWVKHKEKIADPLRRNACAWGHEIMRAWRKKERDEAEAGR